MLDELQWVLRTYTRSFVAQGIGIIGLLWCLYDRHPGFAVVLSTLVLIDQAVFLRQRFAAAPRPRSWQRSLHVWCLGVSLADLLILFAVLYQAEGLHAIGSGSVADPLDFLAFSLATFGRFNLDLAASTGPGRLLAAVEALLGAVILLAFGAWLITMMLYRRSSAEPDPVPQDDDGHEPELG